MEEASDWLQRAPAREGSEESQCAQRLLQTPGAWRRWELEFGAALRPIAANRTRTMQARALRQAGFTWIHLAAPFRHLRDNNLRGKERRALVSGISRQSYARALVIEHDNYLRSVCHSSCAAHLGESVLGDPLYRESMRRYQLLYMEYFRCYCAANFVAVGDFHATPEELLPMLKQQVGELRQAILEYPARRGWLQREATLRRRSGDTQRLVRPSLDIEFD
jgi:hypothetical protein